MRDSNKPSRSSRIRVRDDGTAIWLDKDLRKVFRRTSMKIINQRQDPFTSPSDVIKILIEHYEGKTFSDLLRETEQSAGHG